MNELELFNNIEKSVSAILMILAEMRETNQEVVNKYRDRKIELLLTDSGFNAPEIANILNKNLPGVQKAIQRGRK